MKRVVLIKSWTNKHGRKYPIGKILQGTKEFAQGLIDSGHAIEYGGKYPPAGKVKTDFFKPKKQRNGT